jgi:hypothetical protein
MHHKASGDRHQRVDDEEEREGVAAPAPDFLQLVDLPRKREREKERGKKETGERRSAKSGLQPTDNGGNEEKEEK